MPRTIKINSNPGSRIDGGNTILDAASTADVKPIKARVEAFRRAHVAFVAAHGKVETAEAALRAQQEKVGDADIIQDAAVQTLASCLVGDGLPRQNPFKPLGFAAPSVIVDTGYADEAKIVARLAAKAAAHKSASKNTSENGGKHLVISRKPPCKSILNTTSKLGITNSNLKAIPTATLVVMINMLDIAQRCSNDASLSAWC